MKKNNEEFLTDKETDAGEDEPGQISQFTKDLIKSEYRKGFRNALIFGFILVIIWAVLLAFVPDGWWITVINILFFIATAIVIGMSSIQFLRLYMPKIVAIILSAGIYVIMVVLIRSIILELLGVI